MNSNNIILIKKSTEEVCWTCNKKPATKSEYRDSLGENEMTCADCHRQEYPEQYEEEECTDENKCGECTYCARTKVCEYCGCVGGCDSSCRGDEEEEK